MYSNEEIQRIYSLGRLYLEGGQLRAAEQIFSGLSAIKAEFTPALLGLIYLYVISERWDDIERLIDAAKKNNEYHIEILIFEALFKFSQRDIAAAGTALGEVKDLIESNSVVVDQNILKIFKSQISRYQSLI